MQKEPALNTKMRRDDTMTAVQVKVERSSIESQPEKSTATGSGDSGATAPTTTAASNRESSRPVRIKKEKIDEPVPTKSTSRKATNSSSQAKESRKHSNDDSNDSLEIVAVETNPTIELSDDENGDGNKMPPPAFVPPAKAATKEKKAPAETKIRSTRSKQPKRKVCFKRAICLLTNIWEFIKSFALIYSRSNKSRFRKVRTRLCLAQAILPARKALGQIEMPPKNPRQNVLSIRAVNLYMRMHSRNLLRV